MEIYDARIAASVLAPVVYLFLSIAAAQTLHIGEDGTACHCDVAQADKLAQAGWRQGKVEPELSALALHDAQLDIIVHLARPRPVDGEESPLDIRARHRGMIDALIRQITAVRDRYGTVVPLRENEEKEHVLHVERIMTAADRDLLAELRRELDAVLDRMRTEVGDALVRAGAGERAAITQLIGQAGGTVYAEIPSANALGARIPAGFLDPLALNPQVMRIFLDRPVTYELDVSVPSVGYDVWWPAYTGGVWDFGIVDSGLRTDHPAFSPFTFYTQGTGAIYNDHGTHVAGIVLSNDSTFRGGAYGVDAVIWASRGNHPNPSLSQSITMNNMHWMLTGPPQKPDVVNHSIGYGTADLIDYNDNDSFYDAFIENFGVMITNSAGNNGWNPNYPTITRPASAYNLIAVANMDDRNTVERNDDVRYWSSSVGPTVNDRRKPDISAPGTTIYSTSTEWNGPTGVALDCGSAATIGDDFVECSGTSMAAPHVAAAILLLQDAGNVDPMSQKAVLINAADAWTSSDTDSPSDDGPVAGSHWDKVYGWGYIDMAETYMNSDDYALDSVIPRNDTATPDDYKLYKGLLYANEKLTMVWHKRASTYVPGDPSTGRRALSDLNLRLYRESDGVLLDADQGPADNVHQVSTPTQATVVLKAYAWSTGFDGANSEAFALALEEAFEAVSPPDLRRSFTVTTAGPFQTVDMIVFIHNDGGVAAQDVMLDIENIPGISGFSPTNLGAIAGDGGSAYHTFSVTISGLSAGDYWLPLVASSDSYLETYTHNLVQGVRVTVETTPPVATCTDAPEYNNDDIIEIEWTASDAQTGVDLTYLYVVPPSGSDWVSTGLSLPGPSGTFEFPAGTDGRYLFAARAIDNGGTWEDLPAAAECETFQDTVAPTHTLSSPALSLGDVIPLTRSTNDPEPASGVVSVNYFYMLAGTTSVWNLFASSGPTPGVFSWTPLAGDGTYHFVASAHDHAGNVETLPPPFNGDTTTIYDTMPPTGSITIEGGAATTATLLVDLELPAIDAGAGLADMRLSNNGTFWGPVIPYAPSYSGWNIGDPATGGSSAPGIKTVYVQYRDGAGRQTGALTDTIEFVPQDTDGDGVTDVFDNCVATANPAQRDSDNDNLGNSCDPDIAPVPGNDCVVNFADLGVLKNAFFAQPADARWNPDADLNGDSQINFGDLGIMKSYFFLAPGPSGLPNACQ